MTETPYFTTLKNRGLIRVSGPEARGFLQGLISNDINLLDRQACVYACLLNAQGKFLHDFFITERDGVITLECEGGERAQDLFKKLSMYKLRADVKIECEETVSVYAIFSPLPVGADAPSFPLPHEWGRGIKGEGAIHPDPRHSALGFRSFTKPSLEEKPFEAWDRQRILLTVPDGSRDMIVGSSTLLECNIDKLNGISYEKGCYIGQELTARMHYRNLGKKHLKTVTLPYDGELRSSCGDMGLALVRD